jgi:hypothetical protein
MTLMDEMNDLADKIIAKGEILRGLMHLRDNDEYYENRVRELKGDRNDNRRTTERAQKLSWFE